MVLAVAVTLATGCASKTFRQGKSAAEKGDWDLAVARFTKAVEGDSQNIEMRIALRNARVEASRYHHEQAKQHLAADQLDHALDELDIATKYDPANMAALDELRLVTERLRARDEERRQRSQIDELRDRARRRSLPLPMLSPRSQNPISLRFTDQSLEKVFEALAKLTGVNILFDPDYRDRDVGVALTGVTFEQALEQITFVNKLFYKVVDQNTVIIVPETAQKRRTYDENLVQTFYVENLAVNEALAIITKLTGVQKIVANEPLGAITAVGTPDQLAMIERILDTNDKALGEVIVAVEILEVNRTHMRSYGLALSNYAAGASFFPTGAEGELDEVNEFTNVRAHILSSINLADFIVTLPSTVTANFLKDETNVRILASPRLRAAHGKKASLQIGTEVPIPVTSFTSATPGGSTFAPATSFQYRNVGVTLELTPQITPDGEIIVDMLAEFSTIGADRPIGDLNIPEFLSRRVTGILRLRDGQTTPLGGLLTTRESETLKGVLGLSSIPLIGGLFRSKTVDDDSVEILISITPHLVRAPKLRAEDFESLPVGTQDRTRVPGARPSLFGEASGGDEAAPEVEIETPPAGGDSAAVPTAAGPELEASDAGPAGSEAAPAEPQPSDDPLRALLRPPRLNLSVGEEVTLDVVLLGADALLEVEIVLEIDSRLLAVMRIDPGPLLTLDGSAVGTERSVGADRVTVRFRRPTPTSGSGAIASVRLRGAAGGSGTIRLQSIEVGDGETRRQSSSSAETAVTVSGGAGGDR